MLVTVGKFAIEDVVAVSKSGCLSLFSNLFVYLLVTAGNLFVYTH